MLLKFQSILRTLFSSYTNIFTRISDNFDWPTNTLLFSTLYFSSVLHMKQNREKKRLYTEAAPRLNKHEEFSEGAP